MTEEDNSYDENSNVVGRVVPYQLDLAIGSIHKELGRMTDSESIQQKCKMIKQFAQDKAFFVRQFTRTDETIATGSVVQKTACNEVGIKDEKVAAYIWKMGGMTSFKSGIAMKRKITMCSVENVVKSSTYEWSFTSLQK